MDFTLKTPDGLRAGLRNRPVARGRALNYRIRARAKIFRGPRGGLFEARELFKTRHITSSNVVVYIFDESVHEIKPSFSDHVH